MTKDEALLMALEALDGGAFGKELERVVLAIREALAQQPAQEPVACANGCQGFFKYSPPAKPWVGLTDEEISKTFETKVWDARRSYARAIEAKLKEKNT